jgi:hypothetical protein
MASGDANVSVTIGASKTSRKRKHTEKSTTQNKIKLNARNGQWREGCILCVFLSLFLFLCRRRKWGIRRWFWIFSKMSVKTVKCWKDE